MMEKIVLGEPAHIEDCAQAMLHSDLGRVYFSQPDKAVQAVSEGITKKEIHVALDSDGTCMGFLWVLQNGAFHSFPYLHVIAVKEAYRSQGTGKALLHHFETVLAQSAKAFLVVADFNPRAKRLYEQCGYREVGAIPNLYKKGVLEYLMMKELV